MTPDTVLENCHVQLLNGEYEATLRRYSVKADGNSLVFGMIYCLLVYEDNGEVFGLVIVRSDTVPGAYSRIGYMSGCSAWKAHKKEVKTTTLVWPDFRLKRSLGRA